MKKRLKYALGEYWAGKAHESSTNRGKQLRKDGFALAQEKYRKLHLIALEQVKIYKNIAEDYKPILEEVEKILRESGLDDEDIKKGVTSNPGGVVQNRNRR